MTKRVFAIMILLIAFSTIASAAMNPELKECVQRGYETEHEYGQETVCIFPDNSNCTLSDFNSGICGEEYKTEDYCVEEGLPVWDKDKCCEGTESYLGPKIAGQATCRQVSISQKTSDILLTNPIIIFAVIVIIIVIIFLIIKKRK